MKHNEKCIKLTGETYNILFEYIFNLQLNIS